MNIRGYAMENLALFGILSLAITRFFGFLISIDLYANQRNNRHLIFSSGWLCWFLASFFPILADTITEIFLRDIMLLLNNILITIGAFLLVLAITSISRDYTNKTKLGGFLAILVSFPFILYLGMGLRITNIFFSMILFLANVCIIFINKLAGEDFVQKAGNSYKWILLLRVIVSLQILFIFYLMLIGESYGLYDSNNVFLVILNYGIGISLGIVIVILIIHIEHSVITHQKNFLKDTLTHDIGNILQIINSATEMLSVPEKSVEKTNLILKKSQEASKLINEIKDL